MPNQIEKMKNLIRFMKACPATSEIIAGCIFAVIVCITLFCTLGCQNLTSEQIRAYGEPKDVGKIYTIIAGHSMDPVLVPGDRVVILKTNYYDLEKGMIVTRYMNGKTVTHKLGMQTVRGWWVTYGINKFTNPMPDDKLMTPGDFIGESLILPREG